MNVGVILKYRSQVEESLRTELSRMQGVLHEAEAIVVELERAAEGEAARYVRDVEGGLTVGEVMGRRAELEALAERIRRAKTTVEEHQARCKGKLDEVLLAAQERRKLELVEQRQQQRTAVETGRQEQQELDELAGRRYMAERRSRMADDRDGTSHDQ
jgi:flagellar export protein FliJ